MKTSFRLTSSLSVGIAFLAAVFLSGCGKGAKPADRRPDPTAGGKAPRIVIIAGDPETNWTAAHQGALQAAEELGAVIEWHDLTANNQIAQQKYLIEKATESNASGLAIAPINPSDLVTHINDSGKNYVPAIVFAAPAHTKFKLSYVHSDERATGELAARHIGKLLEGENVVHALSLPIDSPKSDTVVRFEEVIAKEFPHLKVLYNEEIVQAQSGPPAAVFATNEDASKETLKTVSPKIPLIATGARNDLIAALQKGRLSALIFPDRGKLAYESVNALLEFRDHKPPPLEIKIKPFLITPETINEPENREALGISD